MGKPIRILHILQRMEPAGVQTLLMNIYRNIDREKVQFDFLVHYNTPQFFDEEIEKLGGKIYRLSFREDYNFFKYIKDLKEFFSEHKEYKIIHGHMHSLGAIYLSIAKKYKVPIRIAHSHTNNTQNDLKKVLKLVMNHCYKKNATNLFACSEAAGKYMFGKNEFKIINNAIDSEKFSFNKNIREKKIKELKIEGKTVIGCVGRFEIQKNQKFSVEVFDKYHEKNPNSILLMIGSGSMENQIKELVKEKKLEDSVMFLGNRKDINEIYQAMDVFLFPSLFEGLGIVGVEAQASGIPTVCTSTLPKEIDVTPLINRIKLNEKIDNWVNEIEKALNNRKKHTDMKEYIKKANYDIKTVACDLQKFYLETSLNIERGKYE